ADGCRASPCSGARTGGSCGGPTHRSRPATISAASGTSSISFPKAPPAGSRSTTTRETAASDHQESPSASEPTHSIRSTRETTKSGGRENIHPLLKKNQRTRAHLKATLEMVLQ